MLPRGSIGVASRWELPCEAVPYEMSMVRKLEFLRLENIPTCTWSKLHAVNRYRENLSERVCRTSTALYGLVASTPHSRWECLCRGRRTCGHEASTLYSREVSAFSVRELQCGLVASTPQRRRERERERARTSVFFLVKSVTETLVKPTYFPFACGRARERMISESV